MNDAEQKLREVIYGQLSGNQLPYEKKMKLVEDVAKAIEKYVYQPTRSCSEVHPEQDIYCIGGHPVDSKLHDSVGLSPVDGELRERLEQMFDLDIVWELGAHIYEQGDPEYEYKKAFLDRADQLFTTHLQAAVREESKRREGIGAFMAISSIQHHIGYLLAHRANGQYGEMTGQVIHELWTDVKDIQDKNSKYLKAEKPDQGEK
jgi:hypothetical protein